MTVGRGQSYRQGHWYMDEGLSWQEDSRIDSVEKDHKKYFKMYFYFKKAFFSAFKIPGSRKSYPGIRDTREA